MDQKGQLSKLSSSCFLWCFLFNEKTNWKMGQCVLICFLSLKGNEHFWYLDSGYSRHVTCCKSLLSDFVEKDGYIVTFGDNNKGRTEGFGSIQYKTIKFKEVSYVKGIRRNLISISQLCETCYKVYFYENEGNIIDSKNSILVSCH